ncbi:MAG TPA: polyprenyl synthetase family protein [Streptosporangiaceae bacterium]|nr:polyprenyl synthetase family protein [Streptosporangiaceae bacterium]
MTAAPVPTWLTDFAGEVTGRLRALAGGLSEALEPPVSALAGRPGKCFRAMLLCACAGLAGEARDRSSWPGRRDRLVRLGALVELLHLASLLHDDVVDRATTRRGGPAAHTVVGQERAVLAGLACFTLAGMEAASIGGGLDQIVGAAVAGLACGEVLDVERAFDTSMSVDDYLELAERKTGDLFRLSCLLGAAESGAGEAVTDALAKFGADLGVAFQVLDDCLDLRADPTDKPAGTDHLLGLFGAPTLYALAADGSGELARILLAPRFGVADVPAVRALVAANGGLAAAAALARERYKRALAALDEAAGLTEPGAHRSLIALAETLWQAGR